MAATALTDCLALSIDKGTARELMPASLLEALERRAEAPATVVRQFADCSSLKVEQMIASGAFGTVAVVSHGVSGERFAAKKVPRKALADQAMRDQFLDERAALASCSHPFLVKLLGTMRQQATTASLVESGFSDRLWLSSG